MPKVTRRTFLKAMAAGAVAAGCWEGNSAVPTIVAETKYRLNDTKVTSSICIYCGVGCGLFFYAKDGVVVNSEGDPDNPNNEGGLCSKGAAMIEVFTSPKRLKKVMYRAPYANDWQEVEWSWAIPEIAKRIKKTRDESFIRTENGVTVNRTERIAQLGGASHDTDENYLLNKFARMLGIVNLEHQARICHSSTVGSLAPTFGRGAMTNSVTDVANSDVIMFCGGNPAENHPGIMRFVNRAREKGAIVISVDPRYTRSSMLADLYAPLRPGTDIAFFNGLINYTLVNERYFKEYVANYTNASFLVKPEFGFEDGHFSGWNEDTQKYDTSSWDVQRDATGAPIRDVTLTDPMCVFNKMREFYGRYTPETVSKITGIPVETFIKIADVFSSTGTPDRAGTLLYAMGLTQHTHGVQNIRAFAVLQLLLGNIGIPGGGLNALRGESNVQGSTDNSLLYDSLTGYLAAPTAQAHPTLAAYLKAITRPHSWMENAPKFAVSLLKAWYGDHAQPENDFCYDYLPKRSRPHSYMDIFDDMYAGKIDGMIVFGMNPMVSAPNVTKQAHAFDKLDWIIAADLFETETHAFWKRPGADPSKIKTEVFLMPAPGPMEKNGSTTNTSRMLQTRYKAVDPLYECKEDSVMCELILKELQKLYREDPNSVFPEPILNITWGYKTDKEPHYDNEKVFEEMNGRDLVTGKLLDGFAKLKADGTTSSGNWIYCGMFDAQGNNLARRRTPEKSGIGIHREWGWVWPMNRRILYNRASCDLNGVPFSDKKSLIRWDADAKRWVGIDTPDFIGTRAPSDYLGDAPFIMNAYGRGHVFVSAGINDGPLTEHYESYESPIRNKMSSQQFNPVAVYYNSDLDLRSDVDDDNFPYVCTTYRVCEHYQSGAVTRKVLALTEAMPETYVEIDPELAREKGIKNGEVVEVYSIRGSLKVKAFVTPRLQPYNIDGRKIHVVGIPWHYGFIGEDPMSKKNVMQSANMLSPAAGDPNTRIPEYKSFKVNVRRLG